MILCYHGVGPTRAHIYPAFLRVPTAAFRAQLEILKEAGFVFVTVSEFAERSDGRKPPGGLVALSFDDGMDDNHAVVLPILQEYDVRATFYVTTGLIGKSNPWMAKDSGARMMTVHELQDLASAGFEIGAHTVTHPDLSGLDYETCLREVSQSRLALERQLSIPVRTFAYPFCHYSSVTVSAVRAAGYDSAVTCGTGSGSWNPFELPRSIVTSRDGVPGFLFKLANFHHPVFSTLPARVARAATGRVRNRGRKQVKARDPDERAWP